MSSSNQTNMQIGCPECQATINANIPPGTGIQPAESGGVNYLRGTETDCRNCGHELEFYYY